MQTFKQHLKEFSIPPPKTKEEVAELVGKVLFGSLKNKEPDTAKEGMMLRVLKDFIGYADTESKLKIARLKKLFKAIEKHHPEYVKPPEGKIYRKKMIPEDEFNKMMEDGLSDVKKGGAFLFNQGYQYKPKHIVQSWTTEFQSAIAFAPDKVPSKRNIPIILECDPPQKDLLFNSKLTNILAMDNFGLEENETIRVSKKPIKCRMYISRESLKLMEKN